MSLVKQNFENSMPRSENICLLENYEAPQI